MLEGNHFYGPLGPTVHGLTHIFGDSNLSFYVLFGIHDIAMKLRASKSVQKSRIGIFYLQLASETG